MLNIRWLYEKRNWINIIKKKKYKNIRFGIKFGDKNIGFNGHFYTLPYFTMFLLKDFIRALDKNN